MSFKSWSLANPTKSWDYKKLIQQEKALEQSIQEYGDKLDQLKKGILVTASWFPSMLWSSDLWSRMRIDGTKPDSSELERIEAERKQRQIDDNIEVYSKLVIEDYAKLKDLQERKKNFSLNEEIFQYSRYLDSSYLLCTRLAPLEVFNDYFVLKSDDDFENTDFVLYSLSWFTDVYEDCFVEIKFVDGDCTYRVGDSGVSFTRINPTGLIRAWLTYIDYRWDNLIQKERIY